MSNVESLRIKRLEAIHYYVHDLDRSRKFYTGMLDLPEVAKSSPELEARGKQRSVVFETGHSQIVVSAPVGEGGRASRYLKNHPDGIGTLIFEGKDGLLSQVCAGTTNGILGNQTFGITSGTLNCEKFTAFASNEQLDGFVHTGNGWVQSYGSRCVKPPIIFGDISRPKPMTVEWSSYAQGLSRKPVKGMLTGPVTILNWSFPREDIPRSESCLQIAKALRQEVLDLEAAGIGIIQIDEPALREGVPLRESEHKEYFDWAVACFRYTCSEVKPETQIHTHMCYSNFNAIMDAIVALDADVITIESARSDLQLLRSFSQGERACKNGGYPNEIGPGIYDIHSPNVPEREELVARLKKIAEVIPLEKLWVNPDCGLKTRSWAEVGSSLLNMVEPARAVRAELA